MTEEKINKLGELNLYFCFNCKNVVQYGGKNKVTFDDFLLEDVGYSMNCCNRPNYGFLIGDDDLINCFDTDIDL